MFKRLFTDFGTKDILLAAKTDIDTNSAIDIAAVVVTGLVVVFIALIILILFVWLFGKIFDAVKLRKKQNKVTPKPPAPEGKSEIPAPSVSGISEPEPVDDDGEIIAAISAVIAQISSEDGKQYKVKSIKPLSSKKSSSLNAWRLEGLRQNTNPF